MSFLDVLYDTVEQVDGARLVGIIGTDGLRVEMILDEEYVPHSHEAAEMELALLVAQAAQAAEALNVGNAYELMLETDELVYFLSMITPDYYAVLAISLDSDLATAQTAVRQMVERFQTEF
jgi:predicted regulator of Ras-like GTPase activity (Roadblock/LC7/MglB family)